MKLKKTIGKLEVKGLGLTLTQDSTEEELKRAIKHQPNIEQFVEGANVKPKTDKK